MYELRKDPLLGRWVAVAGESVAPSGYEVPSAKKDATSCILCPGREHETPREIASIREGGQWRVRVIPRPQPIFHIEGDLGRKGVGMFDKMNSVGANEVIVESPEHGRNPEDMGQDQVFRVIRVYRDRVADLERDARLRYMMIYKNSGKLAGAAYTHPHAELVATPIIPKRIKEELGGAKQYFAFKERCIFCDLIREELRLGDRIVSETREFIAFCPFAAKFPFEFWILPKRHHCAFTDIGAAEMEDLSGLLSVMLRKMRTVLKNPPFNYVIHTAPNRVPRKDYWHTLGEDFHWHIEVMPRLLRTSGFEWGSGFYVLPTSPEDAAKYLREA